MIGEPLTEVRLRRGFTAHAEVGPDRVARSMKELLVLIEAATRAWAQNRLATPMTVRDLAYHANVSERTFARRVLAETGTTPQRWLATQRLAIARELLEDGALTVEEVARRCGLGSTDNLRLYFRRHLRTTPSAYRRAFSATAADHA
jgi:transcriptional regulator GlxA family with amidase domain